jgi:hypothetical protein
MAYLNLQLAKIIISVGFIYWDKQPRGHSSRLHTFYKNTATRGDYCKSLPLVNLILWCTRECNVTLLTPWLSTIDVFGTWKCFQVLPVWLNGKWHLKNSTFTNKK